MRLKIHDTTRDLHSTLGVLAYPDVLDKQATRLTFRVMHGDVLHLYFFKATVNEALAISLQAQYVAINVAKGQAAYNARSELIEKIREGKVKI